MKTKNKKLKRNGCAWTVKEEKVLLENTSSNLSSVAEQLGRSKSAVAVRWTALQNSKGGISSTIKNNKDDIMDENEIKKIDVDKLKYYSNSSYLGLFEYIKNNGEMIEHEYREHKKCNICNNQKYIHTRVAEVVATKQSLFCKIPIFNDVKVIRTCPACNRTFYDLLRNK